MLLTLFICQNVLCSHLNNNENLVDMRSLDEAMSNPLTDDDEVNTDKNKDNFYGKQREGNEECLLRDSNYQIASLDNEDHESMVIESSIDIPNQTNICVPFRKSKILLESEIEEIVCNSFSMYSEDAGLFSLYHSNQGFKLRNMKTGKAVFYEHKNNHVGTAKNVEDITDIFTYMQRSKFDEFRLSFVLPSKYIPEIFVKDGIKKRGHYNCGCSVYSCSDYVGKIFNNVKLSTVVPAIEEITYDTTVPEFVPLHELTEEYFERMALLINKLESSQREKLLYTVKASIRIDNELLVLPKQTQEMQEETSIDSDSKSKDKITKEDVYIDINEEYTHTNLIQSDGVTVESPFKIIYPLSKETYHKIYNEIDMMKFYIPTLIKGNSTFESPIVTLRIPGGDNDFKLIAPTCNIGRFNTFKRTSRLKYFSQDTIIGDYNVFEDFYIGPNVTIGNYNALKSFLVFANSSIGNHVKIGKYVVIGRNVTINDGAIIKDYAFIQDGVSIGANAIIRNNVYIYKEAAISPSVRLDRGIIIGTKSTVGKNTEMSVSCFVGDYAEIGNSCSFIKGVNIDSEMIIEDCCKFDNTVIIKMKSAGDEKTIVDIERKDRTIGKNSTFIDGVKLVGSCGESTKLTHKVTIDGTLGKNCIFKDSIYFEGKCHDNVMMLYKVEATDAIVKSNSVFFNHVIFNGNCGVYTKLWDQVNLNGTIGKNCTFSNEVLFGGYCGDSVRLYENIQAQAGNIGHGSVFVHGINFIGSCGIGTKMTESVRVIGTIGNNCKLRNRVNLRNAKLMNNVDLRNIVMIDENTVVVDDMVINFNVSIGKNHIVGGENNTIDYFIDKDDDMEREDNTVENYTTGDRKTFL